MLAFAGATYIRIQWEEDETGNIIYLFTLSCIITVATTLALTAAILYVSSLQIRLRKQMNEYFNLINRMREGVLVLTKDLKGALEI